MKKKVMIAIDSFFDGGSEMFAIRLANALSDKYSVYFLEYIGSINKPKNQKKHLSSSVILFTPDETFLGRFLLRIEKFLKKIFPAAKINLAFWIRQWIIKRFIVENQIHCINTHAYKVNTCMAFIKKELPNLHLVLKNCGHYEVYRKKLSPPIFDLNICLHIENFDGFIFLTNDQLKTFLEYGFDERKAQFIYNGLELNATSILSPSIISPFRPVKIILVSRAIPEKGWIETIEAVKMLNSEGYRVQLTLVGDGPTYESLLSQPLPDSITLTGAVQDVFSLIDDSDIGLLPSCYYAESLPNCVIEYLSRGKPVIATNLGAIPDMLSVDGELAGELISANRGQPVAPFLIKSALIKLISDTGYYQHKAQLAIRAAKKFDMSYCLKQYENIMNLSN